MAQTPQKPSDSDGYLSEDMKVDVGSFSLDSLDLGEEKPEEPAEKTTEE